MNTTGRNTRADGRPKRRWSSADDKKLVMFWGDVSIRELAKLLDRTELTVYWRGRKLGLPCGCPDGYEYLTDAARRAGYCTGQLRRILRAGRVRLRQSISRPPQQGAGYHIVDSFEVDRAVAEWLTCEELQAIADRHGICGSTLRKLMVEAGYQPPKPAKRRWRIPTEAAERAIKAWRERRVALSVSQHASRVGLSRQTLAERLRRAGVLGPKRPGGAAVRLPNEVVDLAIGRRAA